MFKGKDISEEQLYFLIYCITALSLNWGKTPDEVYKIISDNNVIDNYIIKYYDELHTQSEDYIVNEISELLKHEGISI